MSDHVHEDLQLQQKLEAERREKEGRREIEALQREIEAIRRENQKTTLQEYLFNCHFHYYKALRPADISRLSPGFTRVDGQYYPKWLRPWASFANTQRQHHFEAIKRVCGERRLFFQSSTTKDLGKDNRSLQAGFEKDINFFERYVVESTILNILDPVWDEEELRMEYRCEKLQFSYVEGFIQPSDYGLVGEEHPSGESNERVQPPPTKPRGAGVRIHPDGAESLAFIYEHKAAHKIAVEYLKPAIAKENLFMEVVERINSNKSLSDAKLRAQDRAEELIAMALTQAFDHMVKHGVSYGYIAAGMSLLLLHIDREDPQTLYCHPCVPDEDVGSEVDWVNEKASYTAAAQLASFCLLSFRSEPLREALLDAALQKADASLRIWSEPYEEAAAEEVAAAEDDTELSESAPTRQYCTQACLLGLKRGWDLDSNCPNVLSHRTAEGGGTRHSIDADEFARLVGERFRRHPYRDCEALDYKRGAVGVLFKLELAPYGYTFVGKGTLPVYLGRLEHEGRIYAHLDRLQGEVVPVHLGLAHLERGYVLPGGVRVFDMMLMSWAGETEKPVGATATDAGAGATDLAAEVLRSEQAVWDEGVWHGDKRSANRLWNDERRRVMIIDFDRAVLRPSPSLKQLSKVSRKRRRQGGSSRREL